MSKIGTMAYQFSYLNGLFFTHWNWYNCWRCQAPQRHPIFLVQETMVTSLFYTNREPQLLHKSIPDLSQRYIFFIPRGVSKGRRYHLFFYIGRCRDIAFRGDKYLYQCRIECVLNKRKLYQRCGIIGMKKLRCTALIFRYFRLYQKVERMGFKRS